MEREALDITRIVEIMKFGTSYSVRYFLDRETGEIIGIPDEVFLAIENEEEDSLRPSQRSLLEKARMIYPGNGRFASIPPLVDSDIYSVLTELNEKLESRDAKDAMAQVLASRDLEESFDEVCARYPELMDLFSDLVDEYAERMARLWLEKLGVRMDP